ncbi:DUF3667 domain-containing protein [Stenotrophomonas sp. NPDC077659]|uniref:DUF3667 domain-containing protein n=1 Tax=Stenotrophomonas sp. NPDC077659 TaxID=3390694 RepID=UPI003CFCB1D2
MHAALPDADSAAQAACENCDTALQGHYCHHCGQSAHNPPKHVGHAIEEVFESFWHVDGRIFRTLRDLWVPGRIALNYLKGRRVGCVQPLRLFGKAVTAEQFEAVRAQQMALIDQQASTTNAGSPGFAIAQAAVNAAAAQRKAKLGTPAAAAVQPADDDHSTFFNYTINDKPWDADTNPIVLTGLLQFANHRLNRLLQNGNANIQRMVGKTDLTMQAILTARPARCSS